MKAHPKRDVQLRRAKKKFKKTVNQRKRAKQRRRRLAAERAQGGNIVNQIYWTIQHFFPDLFEWMRKIDDYRQHSNYELAEIITACLAIFLFKTGSRNELNNLRINRNFRNNYKKLFKLDLPHLDTVHNVIEILSEEHLEKLKQRMIQALLKKKVLHKYRFRGMFIIAIDGTGVASYDHKHCEQCLHKTSKKGKTTYFHNVLEAKLITANGFAFSIGTEWIENPTEEYNKQDCERKAFTRLAEKIKKDYPRLPICLTVDSLYPYQGFFDTCKKYNWHYIVTFKDNCLPSVTAKAENIKSLHPQNTRKEVIDIKRTQRVYRWVTNIKYHNHTLHWIECEETVSKKDGSDEICRFVYLTDIEPNYQTVPSLIATGRMRWKIENEGFNIQKNHGYNLEHKYARNSYRAMKNYYQAMQIAHIINELLVLSKSFKKLLVPKMSIKHLWIELIGFMLYGSINNLELQSVSANSAQARFVT